MSVLGNNSSEQSVKVTVCCLQGKHWYIGDIQIGLLHRSGDSMYRPLFGIRVAARLQPPQKTAQQTLPCQGEREHPGLNQDKLKTNYLIRECTRSFVCRLCPWQTAVCDSDGLNESDARELGAGRDASVGYETRSSCLSAVLTVAGQLVDRSGRWEFSILSDTGSIHASKYPFTLASGIENISKNCD